MRIGTAALMLTLGFAAPAPADEAYDTCVGKGQTDMDYRECGGAWLERADADLNRMWKALRDMSTPETGKALLEEQRAWNAYKEKSCLFWASGEYGTIGSALNFPACRAAAIEARTIELGNYLDELKQH
jgi:uncharacterized protein YecT (DUF1311 family)